VVGYYERKPIENESHSERKQAETEGTAKLLRKRDAPSASPGGEMVQNGTQSDHLNRLSGPVAKWFEMVPKATIWTV